MISPRRCQSETLPRRSGAALATFTLLSLAACADGADKQPDGAAFALKVSSIDRRFRTRDHFIASVEMQISGEPFAEAMGRDLGGYSRNYVCQGAVCSPSTYADPAAPLVSTDAGDVPEERIDLAGFSSAVESYEYSKQPMNNIAFESGAGTPLLFGRVLNPEGLTGKAALQLTQAWLTRMAMASNASRRAQVTADRPLGWPGLWPTLQPFASWDPTIHPAHGGVCSLSSDDNPGAAQAVVSNDYECDYRTLNLPRRASQVSMTIGPGASGWTDWKEALWTLNYLQVMHDARETPVTDILEQRLPEVGIPGNTVGPGTRPGTYLGSSDIEGFQAGNFIQILDNQAAEWLFALTTTDGKTLGGFASVADALAYRPADRLRWFPASIVVTESDDESGFPRPSGYRIESADSHLLDLAGLLGAYASIYALTDQANVEVGGSQPARAYFDGDPLPVQNQTPEGADTLHDRALAMMRVLLVNIERMHFDAERGLFADDASVTGGEASRGELLSSDVAAYALLALRTARRALDSELTLYANTTPDVAGVPTPLDRFALLRGVSQAQRLDHLIGALCAIFSEKLTTSDGIAFAGWRVGRAAPADVGTSLDAHTAAIRGLLIAYLATGATKYRERALRVWQRLERAFYDPDVRIYRAVAGERASKVTFTPRRFGLLQAALRDTYELIALLPGNEAMRVVIEDRVGRLNKLVLNGWDDRDRDGRVEWPSECAQLGKGPDGEPLGLGGLQMAERTLTGESGTLPDPDAAGNMVIVSDREHDCVPEISAVGWPAALASSITFTLTKLATPATPDAGEAVEHAAQALQRRRDLRALRLAARVRR